MKKKRPTGVTIFAILNIVFGALGLIGGMCGIANQLARPMLQNMQAQAAGPGKAAPPDVQRLLEDKIPYYGALERTQLAVGLVASAVLLVAGIALLRMSAAGRWVCIAYGLVRIPLAIAEGVWSILVLGPVMDDVMKEATAGVELPSGFGNSLTIVLTGVSVVLAVGYSLAMLIYMLLPGTARAFAAGVQDTEPPANDQEYYDPEYRRERRDLPPEN